MDELRKEIPETLDVFELVFAAAFVLKKHFMDGVQADDFLKIVMEYFQNDEFQNKFKTAIEGAYKIPTEIKNAIVGLKFGLLLELVKYIGFNLKRLLSSTLPLE